MSVEEAQRLADKNLGGRFAKTNAGDVVIPLEAVPVLLGQYIAQRVVRQAEQEVVTSCHFALEIIPNVRQCLARNSENLRITNVHKVDAGGDRFFV